jgi:hypothetical protein
MSSAIDLDVPHIFLPALPACTLTSPAPTSRGRPIILGIPCPYCPTH